VPDKSSVLSRPPGQCFEDLYNDAMERHRRYRVRMEQRLHLKYEEIKAPMDRMDTCLSKTQSMWPGGGDAVRNARSASAERKESLRQFIVDQGYDERKRREMPRSYSDLVDKKVRRRSSCPDSLGSSSSARSLRTSSDSPRGDRRRLYGAKFLE